MKVLIIEDEKLNILRLERILAEIPINVEIVGITGSIKDSVLWFENNPHPDVVLMDVRLEDGISFEIFDKTKIDVPVIFTTSYDEYAVRAFKVNSLDYLLKPIEKDDLEVALQKVKTEGATDALKDIDKILKQLEQTSKIYRKRFLVKKHNAYLSLDVKDVDFIFSENKITYLISKEHEQFVLDQTLEDIIDELDSDSFFRANRQYILSIDSILALKDNVNGKLRIILRRDSSREIIISRDKAPLLKIWLDK